jgi:hypothetical protein
MFSKVMSIEMAGSPHNPGDVIHIDGERWFVVSTDFNGHSSKVWLEPLSSYIAKNTLISKVPYDCTIAEYLNRLCDEYEADCCC